MMQLEGGFTIERGCDLAQVNRAGYYRHFQEHAPRQAETHLRDAIQRAALENRCYGYRRVQAALRQEGILVNHKRVQRVLREDNLLSLRKRKWVLTTNSRHEFTIYPNLAADLVLSGLNQLWVADITYIRLLEEFVFLAVILDAYSRRVVGWELSESLQAEIALKALDRALGARPIQPGIVHHSDQGIQYCCTEYVEKLKSHEFLVSMSRRGNPYDNAKAESFMKTLKSEEVYLKQYRDLEDARSSITQFIEQVYNGRRLHSALGYLSPAAYEAALPRDSKHTEAA